MRKYDIIKTFTFLLQLLKDLRVKDILKLVLPASSLVPVFSGAGLARFLYPQVMLFAPRVDSAAGELAGRFTRGVRGQDNAGRSLGAGITFCRMQADGFTHAEKMC